MTNGTLCRHFEVTLRNKLNGRRPDAMVDPSDILYSASYRWAAFILLQDSRRSRIENFCHLFAHTSIFPVLEYDMSIIFSINDIICGII